MKKDVNFLPERHLKQKLLKVETALRNAIMLLIAVNLFMAFLWCRNHSSIKTLEDKKQQILSSAAAQKNTALQKDFTALIAMNHFVSDFSSLKIIAAAMEGSKISFQTEVKDALDYYKIVKEIEDKKRYKITGIGKIEQKDAVYLKISLEVVNVQN